MIPVVGVYDGIFMDQERLVNRSSFSFVFKQIRFLKAFSQIV